MAAQESVISELEDAIKRGSPERRVETLRRVTDLFLRDADRLNEAQVGLFDDILSHLIKRIETKALVDLSEHLAPVDNAPTEVIRRLARDDEIAVAGPVLIQSAKLTTDDLVEIAETKGQGHLLAISGRKQLEETITDVLLDRGDRQVVHRLARNEGARFSETGFETLVRNADSDESLVEKIGLRLDLPLRPLRDLLMKATEAVRARILAVASPEIQDKIQNVLAKALNEVSREASAPRDFTQAWQSIQLMQQHGKLDEAAILEFVTERKYEEMVAALAALCSSSIELIAPLMRSERNDGLLIPCKAAGLKWPTVGAILKNRRAHHSISDDDYTKAKRDFLGLSQASAQRILRFWKVRAPAS